MSIVHFIPGGVFASGYINFMKMKMNKYVHFFIMSDEGFELNLIDEKNIIIFSDYSKIKKEKDILQRLHESELIIVSGVFGSFRMLMHFPKVFLKKTLLQFWGGDFYGLRRNSAFQRLYDHRITWRKIYYRKCAGFIFLIDGEYEKFKEILGIEKRHYVAPMPADPNQGFKVADFRKEKNNYDIVKIMVGNSATPTNQHFEIVDWLSNYTDCNIEVYMPLSYGSAEYRGNLVDYATKKLGSCFRPIIEFMELRLYIEFIASMDIAVFNNNRQQAMGNIEICLGLGKKVFIRDDTSMWGRYVNDGYKIFPIQNTGKMDFEEFTRFDKRYKEKNIMKYDEEDREEKAISLWETVFCSEIDMKK